MSKRVLIISYYWPPTSGSGVQRWLKMSKYLPQYGWQPVIYTPENPEADVTDQSLIQDIGPEVEVVKRRIIEPYAVFNAVTGKKKGTGAINPISVSEHKSLMMRLSLWVRANIFIPDPRCLWIRPSVRFLKKYLREHPVDAIISTGPPHSMHLIAKGVHRATGIPWIADFRDPWTGIVFFKHLPLSRRSLRRHRRLEQSVLKEADKVVSVSELSVQDILSVLSPDYPYKNKFHVIENGYDEADFADITPADLPGRFNIVHTGLFFSNRNPQILWKVLAELRRELPGFAGDLHLIFAGKTDAEVIASVKDAGLGDCLTDLGYRPHHETNSLQKGADILLLPLHKEPEAAGALTGKYFEYLAAGRPIVAFGQHDSSLEQSLAQTRTGRLFDWDEEAPLKEYLTALYTGTTAFDPDPDAISAYTRRSLAGRFAALLDTMQEGK
ncbi:MAG TPA: glycosyltransferase family 4 protein [Candidatus Coprenecus stercoravium]|uniref:Glycosyltransferase family 4 protein n=1 Tax=Candidatus Coprenecus stercoravium TaxID=2840735 RepID=A0A9D2GNS6_9BACT|nr:glycosyltransferase family 4 protein [Candidatus Coprenecus stercoravium]